MVKAVEFNLSNIVFDENGLSHQVVIHYFATVSASAPASYIIRFIKDQHKSLECNLMKWQPALLLLAKAGLASTQKFM